MQVSFTSKTYVQDTFLLNNYLMSYASDDTETQRCSYKVVSKTAGFKWKYRVLKNFPQNKIRTGMVVGHGKHLHQPSGRREKGNKVQYINKWINIAHFLSFFPSVRIFPSQNIFLQFSIDDISSLPPFHLHQPYSLAPHYWRHITAPSLPYINPVLGWPAFFLDSWPLRTCPETSVRSYHYLLHNDPEKHSSHSYKVVTCVQVARWWF